MLISCVLLWKNEEFVVNSRELLNGARKLCDHKLKCVCVCVCMIMRLHEVVMSDNTGALIPMFPP